MKRFKQTINNIEKEKNKEKIKKTLKKKYKECTEFAEKDLEQLESQINNFAECKDDYISLGALYSYHKEIEFSNHIAQLYKNLFDEKIDK